MTIRTKINLIALLLVIAAAIPASANALTFPNSLPEQNTQLPDKGFGVYQNERPKVLQGLSFGNLSSLPVVQQPRGNMTFVSPVQDYVTEYQAAAEFGTIGLLAHNYLAGQYFFKITSGQEITLVYSDATTKKFIVTEVLQYQALTPASPSSDFVDLSTGKQLTASQLFRSTYGSGSGHLILQTCISANENSSWGRLFIIAEPMDQISTLK